MTVILLRWEHFNSSGKNLEFVGLHFFNLYPTKKMIQVHSE